MNPDKARRQTIKVIVSEIFMVITVIITVIVLALLVSGYWLNSNFEIERNGMLQVSSMPTGANVTIDNQTSSWLERTNASKILASGHHSITLTKDGYDSWSKDITIAEGLLYRLHYPRLFLQNRYSETVLDTIDYTNASASSDHNAFLLMNSTTEWAYLDLDTDNPVPRKIDISKLFSSVSMAEDSKLGLFTGRIMSANWDFDASHVLLEARTTDDTSEWVLLDINNVSKSINLTKEFGGNFSRVEILDNNSNNLLVLQNHNLHKIDIPGRLISAVLAENVIDFDHYHNEIVFSAHRGSSDMSESTSSSYIGYFKLGDRAPTELVGVDSDAKVAIGKFYESQYVAVLQDSVVTVYSKEPEPNEAISYELAFVPDKMRIGHDGEFIIFNAGNEMATLDFEANAVRSWQIENSFGWLDNDMLYTVSDGDLIVYDYDGLNRRVIAHNVSSRFPATITSDKWLYYFSDDGLLREWLIIK